MICCFNKIGFELFLAQNPDLKRVTLRQVTLLNKDKSLLRVCINCTPDSIGRDYEYIKVY
jgi:hypothetical protein